MTLNNSLVSKEMLLASAGFDNLPEHWNVVEVGDLLSSDRGISVGVMYPGKHDPNGIPLIKAGDMNDHRINPEPQFRITPEKHHEYRRTIFEGGEILMTLVGAIGQCAIVPDEMVGWNAARAVAVIRLRNADDAPFVRFCFLSRPLRHLMTVWANTTVQPTLNLKEIKQLPLPWPPKTERDEIAAVLSAFDDKIELNRQMNATLEAMARALFKSWFIDFDPVRRNQAGQPSRPYDYLFPDRLVKVGGNGRELPEGWKIKKIDDFIKRLSVGKKYSQKTVSTEGAVPVLDQGKSGIIGYHNNKPGVIASLKKPIPVFANHTCYMRLITFPFSAIQNVIPFVGVNVNTIWAYYATLGKQQFLEYKGHWPDFIIHEVVVPPKELTDTFAQSVQSFIEKIRINELESETLVGLRDTLLPHLISGHLRVPNQPFGLEAAT